MFLLACAETPDDDEVTTPALELEPLVIGEGSVELIDEGDRWTPVVSGEVEAFALHGSWSLDADAPRLWRQGWQSWSWSGVVALEDVVLDGELPRAGGDGDAYGVLDETPWSSWSAMALGEDGAVLHLGATGAAKEKIWFAVDEDEIWIVWDGPLPEGGLDAVELRSGPDAYALWTEWAAGFAGRVGPVPSGWSDWYSFYGAATEDDILGNAEVAAELGLEVLQVDDGWELAWGDWSAGEAFPSGTAALAAEIDALGLRPGLWMAPLLVDRASATYAAHPDWWVTDEAGVELEDMACDCATLDVTDPEAAAWMQARIAEKVAEGWTYLKLDFLYAGAREGRRDEDLNGAQAYALAVQLLREAAGEDTWILACGAPMLGSVGFADSWRSGADIAFSVFPEPDRAFARWQARATAARSWANGRWWWNDADNLILRAPFEDATAAVAAQAASGGVWLLGDDLRTLGEERTALAMAPIELRGMEFIPEDPWDFVSGLDGSPVIERGTGDDEAPLRWVGDAGVVLFNLGDETVTVEGPGGTELLSGALAEPGLRTLGPGVGEIWR